MSDRIEKKQKLSEEEFIRTLEIDNKTFLFAIRHYYELNKNNKKKLIKKSWTCKDFIGDTGLHVYAGITQKFSEVKLIVGEILKISPQASPGYYKLDCRVGKLKSTPCLGIFKTGNSGIIRDCHYVVRWW
jgi:hypothetical protein